MSQLQTDRMPLDAGDTGYGSVVGPGLSGGAGGSETAPLLIPEPEPEPAGAVAAPEQGGAGGRSRRPVVEEAALLPGATVLDGLARHPGHLHRHHSDESPARGHSAAVVAEVSVPPAAAQHGGGGAGGHQR